MKSYGKIDDWVTYVPEYDGNRQDAEPVTVEIKPLTVREARDAAKNVAARRGKSGAFMTDAAEKNMRIVRSHARNIRNLTVEDRQITSIEELEGTRLINLYTEIEEAINDISTLTEGDIKNFGSRSAGSPEKEPGTATSAPTS